MDGFDDLDPERLDGRQGLRHLFSPDKIRGHITYMSAFDTFK